MNTFRFIIPENSLEKLECAGLRFQKMERLRIQNGIVLRGKKPLTADEFRARRNHYRAVMICPDRKLFCQALGLPTDEGGIVEGLTVAEYAKECGKSRQFINAEIKRGNIPALKIGNYWIIQREIKNDGNSLGSPVVG